MKRPKKERKWLKRLSLFCLFVASFVTIVGSVVVYSKIATLPKVDAQYLKTHGVTEIYDANGTVIYKPTDRRVTAVTYDQVDDILYTQALIATEDADFMTSKGVSPKAILNIPVSIIRSKIDPEFQARGGSTLEQQLIKNTYYNGGVGVDTLTRKIQEWWLAYQLNANFDKPQILEFYLNKLEFAEGATGIAAIMRTYFGKTPADYAERSIPNIAEQAYLAGLGQAPSSYNLYENPEVAAERKNIVLGVLLEKEIISQDEYNQAVAYDLTTGLKPRFWESEEQRAMNLKYKVYTDEVLNEAEALGYNLDDISLKIHTFLQPELFDQITAKVREDVYYQDGQGGTEQVGATVIDSQGIVVGMVGSRYDGDELNRATQNTRSSGSTMKTFTAYGPLLQYMGGSYNTTSMFDSSNYLYPGTNVYMHNWGRYTYGMVNLQDSLRLSLNTPVARIDDEILGSTRIKTFLHGLGLDVKDVYSSVDGIGINISTLQAAAAYNAVNNGGVYTEPRFIQRIEFSDGSIKEIPARQHQAMNPSVAYVLTQILRGTLQPNSTARQAIIPEFEGYAAKTGTVGLDETSQAPNVYGDGGTDSWFDSITNGGYSIAIWLGYDEPNTSPQVADRHTGPQWMGRDLQRMLNAGRHVPNWERPANVNVLGGAGINTHYAVTDAADIDNYAVYSVAEVPTLYGSLPNLAVADSSALDVSWENKLTGREKTLYELYKRNPEIVNENSVISEEVYKAIGGTP